MTRRQVLAGLGGLAVSGCGSLHAGTGAATNAVTRRAAEPPGTLLWHVTTPFPILDLVATDGIVCAGIASQALNKPSSLCALDAATGRKIWTFSNPNGLAPLAASPGVVYCAGLDGIWAVSIASRRVLWRSPGFMNSNPDFQGLQYYGGTVFTAEGPGSGRASLVALDPSSGGRRWATDSRHILTTLGISGGHVYLGHPAASFKGPGELVVLDSASGTPDWTFRDPKITPGMLAFGGGAVVYAASELDTGEPGMAGLDAATGSLLWRSSPRQYLWPIAGAGDMIVGAKAGTLTAIDARTGRTAWRAAPATGGAFALMVHGDTVITTTLSKAGPGLLAVSVADGHELWRHPTGQMVFGYAALDGVVYAAAGGLSADGPGAIYAVQA